jgi:protein ImuA
LAERAQKIQARYHAPQKRVESGFDELDAALGGGFPAGALHELIAASNATGARALALRIAANAAGAGRWILYFDAAGDLYPPSAEFMGISLERLLVVRIHRRADTLWALEQALRCSAVAAVVAAVGRLEPLEARRLQLAAEIGGAVVLLVSTLPERGGGVNLGPATFAATRLLLSPIAVEEASKAERRSVRAEILKSREGGAAARVVDVLLEDGFQRRQRGDAEDTKKTQRRKYS